MVPRLFTIMAVMVTLLTVNRGPLAAGTQPSNAKRVLRLSLSQSVILALKNNRPLQTSRRAISTAASNYRAAKAGYYPVVEAAVTGSQNLQTIAVNQEIESVQTFTAGFNITATMPLDFSGAIGRSVQQALISFITSKASYVTASQNLIAQVYQQYYELLRAKQAIKIDQAQVDQTADQLRIAQERLKTGRVPEVDVLTAKVQYDNARQNLKVDEGELEIAKSQLRNTLVVSQTVDIIPTDHLTFKPEKFKFEKAIREAMHNRVEIKSARLSLQAARIALKSAYDAYLPTFSLSLGYGYNIDGRNPVEAWQLRPRGATAAVGGTINIPIFIFDGGVIRENKVRAMIGIEQADANWKESRETVSLEVKNNLTLLDNSRERVEIVQSSINLAKESLRIAEMRYSMGVTSYLELTDARNNLRTAELNFLNALISYNNAKVNVLRVMGRPLFNPSAQESASPLTTLDDEKKILDTKTR
ncbi:MAG: TolC family protein [Deltaproteobacteria bacterium]